MLKKRPVPATVFVEHKVVTPITVEHFCANDSLMQTGLLRTGQLIKASIA